MPAWQRAYMTTHEAPRDRVDRCLRRQVDAAPIENPVDKPVVVEAACALVGIALPADGKLHCRELPLEVTFPPGTEVSRQNELYSAKIDKA